MTSVQGSLSIEHICRIAGVSRASFYRFLLPRQENQQEMELRSQIQMLAVQHRRRYGYRRIAIALQNQGFHVNGKRVLRLMREDNLLALRHRKFVATTDANHSLHVYLNLAARMTLSGINQLWVADITYIRLQNEFVYLAVLLDAFSRKVIGWALDRTMTSKLTLTALQQALTERQPLPGLVHHSDRGLQYADSGYVALLQQHHILPSMSRAGNPYDNAVCESFMKTLKVEEIYAAQYQDLEHLRANLQSFLEQYYNRQRLHSALDYRSPEQFELDLASRQADNSTVAADVSFFRHGEIYPRMGEQPASCSPAHPVDEFPAGYSSAGWSPPEPASASPAGTIVRSKDSV